jgi:acyl carrier protein
MGLESVEIVLALEETFAIKFPRWIHHFPRTVGELEEMVLQLRREQLPAEVCSAVEEWDVREVVRGVIAKELGIDAALVTPEAILVGDLGMDA